MLNVYIFVNFTVFFSTFIFFAVWFYVSKNVPKFISRPAFLRAESSSVLNCLLSSRIFSFLSSDLTWNFLEINQEFCLKSKKSGQRMAKKKYFVSVTEQPKRILRSLILHITKYQLLCYALFIEANGTRSKLLESNHLQVC